MNQRDVDRARLTTRTAEGGFDWGKIAIIAGVPIALLAIGVVSTFADWFPGPNGGLQWVAVSFGAIGIFVFTVFYSDSKDIRTAIAATLTITYFSTLFVILFNTTAREAVTTGDAKDLFDGFTALVGVMVVFYFGGKTVEKTAEIKAGEVETKARIERGDNPGVGGDPQRQAGPQGS